MVVADLHMGWEATLTQKGVHIPSQTPKILDKMLRLIKAAKPTRIIFVGDVKHAVSGVEIEEWRDIPDFFEAIQKKVSTIQVVLGNHDGNLEPLLPGAVEILPHTGVALGDVGLFHGHAWPGPELLNCRNLVMAHVHPMVAFRDPIGFRIRRPVWIKADCRGLDLAKPFLKHLGVKIEQQVKARLQSQPSIKAKPSHLFVMPAFNDFLGGQAINKPRLGRNRRSKPFIGPVLRSGSVDIESAQIFLLDGTFLGTIGQLEGFS